MASVGVEIVVGVTTGEIVLLTSAIGYGLRRLFNLVGELRLANGVNLVVDAEVERRLTDLEVTTGELGKTTQDHSRRLATLAASLKAHRQMRHTHG